MYLPIEPQPSSALAWLAAARRVNAEDRHQAHNVIIGVANPLIVTTADRAIIANVDEFLRAHHRMPVETIANTIFPQAIFDKYGSPDFYAAYLRKVYPRLKRSQGDWGRYFERMISFPLPKKGQAINPLDDQAINPLDDLVTKLKSQLRSGRCYMNIYELPIYDPIRDAGRVMNRQCLSFLSFKLTEPPRKLLLTALYRNHYYIERLLGNLIGLGRLMKFVADEAGVAVGDLTVVSTHAVVDDAKASRPLVDRLLEESAKAATLAS